jgi:hypothetical protein
MILEALSNTEVCLPSVDWILPLRNLSQNFTFLKSQLFVFAYVHSMISSSTSLAQYFAQSVVLSLEDTVPISLSHSLGKLLDLIGFAKSTNLATPPLLPASEALSTFEILFKQLSRCKSPELLSFSETLLSYFSLDVKPEPVYQDMQFMVVKFMFSLCQSLSDASVAPYERAFICKISECAPVDVLKTELELRIQGLSSVQSLNSIAWILSTTSKRFDCTNLWMTLLKTAYKSAAVDQVKSIASGLFSYLSKTSADTREDWTIRLLDLTVLNINNSSSANRFWNHGVLMALCSWHGKQNHAILEWSDDTLLLKLPDILLDFPKVLRRIKPEIEEKVIYKHESRCLQFLLILSNRFERDLERFRVYVTISFVCRHCKKRLDLNKLRNQSVIHW